MYQEADDFRFASGKTPIRECEVPARAAKQVRAAIKRLGARGLVLPETPPHRSENVEGRFSSIPKARRKLMTVPIASMINVIGLFP